MTSGKVVTTIGYERRWNAALGFEDRERFVRYMTEGQPPRPANMERIVRINLGREHASTADPNPAPLSDAEVSRRVAEGEILLDARPLEAFESGHIAGSFESDLRNPAFEQNAGWILPPDRGVVLVVDGPDAARLAAHKLAFVGLDRRVSGWISFAAWRDAGRPVEALPSMDIAALRRGVEAGRVRVLDVRENSEWRDGHIAAATHVNFRHLPSTLPTLGLRPEEPLAVVCAMGGRSAIAWSILRHHGFRDVRNVTGGMIAWQRAGLPVTR